MKGDRIEDEERRLILSGESEVRNMYEFLAYFFFFSMKIVHVIIMQGYINSR